MDFDSSLVIDPKAKADAIEADIFYTSRQIDVFQKAIPEAKVVRLPNASHYVFRSNDLDIELAMNTFLAELK